MLPDEMKKWSKLVQDFQEDEDKPDFSHLPSADVIKQLRPQIAAKAQRVYDEWIQDENDDLNGGGICHLIADEICDILGQANILCTSVSASDVQHVYVVAQCQEGVFEVDIPYWLYEEGGGFTWTKLPDIRFEPNDVIIRKLDSDPGNMRTYFEEWEAWD